MDTLNKIWSGVKSTLIGSSPIGQSLAIGNALRGTQQAPQVNAQTNQPVVSSPQLAKVKAPVLSPIQPIVNTPQPKTPFKLDTTNITSDYLGGNNTPTSVLSSLPQANPYQGITQQYQQNVAPYNTALATQFSPEYLNAYNKTLDTNQGFRAGVQNIRSRPEALDFQQGQEAALTRDTALTQQANAENMALQEAIRQNNISTATAGRGMAQDQFTNQFNAIQGGLNYGISAGGLGVQQQQASQGRYEYQQITDPNTGFPTIQIIDKQTGLPSGNISPGSPQGQQLMQSGMITGPQAPQPGIIGGYDISTYATDPNHENAVTGWYQAIQNATQGIGGITNANTAEQIINQLAPNSPITGQMIINSAQKYGVDPALMVSLMQQDSQMGTKGKAVKTFNPGNIGNDDSGKTVNMGSWANGVDAVAHWLTQHQAGQTNQVDNSYQNTVAQAPAQLQSAIKSLPDGTAYIDSNSVPSQFAVMANNFASGKGIKVLNAQDATAISTINQSIKNMQTLSNTFADLASEGALGAITSNITDPLSKLARTNYGSQLKSYQSNREGLFQQIRALAGSSPRLNGQELNTAASSMPTLDALNKDTLKDGINKLVKTQSYLDNAIRTFIPNYAGTPVQVGNQYAILGPDGKAYVFPDAQSALQALKLK